MAGVGEKLKKAREAKGLSLQQVHEETKIHIKTLKNIEEGQLQRLPSMIYAKSFIKEYSEFLGLDSNEILKQFFNKPGSKDAKLELIIEEKKLPPFKPVQVRTIAIGAIGLIAIFSIFSLVFSRPHKEGVQPAAKKEVTRQKKAKSAAKTARKLDLVVKAKNDCWLLIKADRKLLFDDVLPKGSVEQWTAKNSFSLRISEGRSVELSLNEKPLGSPGSGFIKELKITHKGISRK